MALSVNEYREKIRSYTCRDIAFRIGDDSDKWTTWIIGNRVFSNATSGACVSYGHDCPPYMSICDDVAFNTLVLAKQLHFKQCILHKYTRQVSLDEPLQLREIYILSGPLDMHATPGCIVIKNIEVRSFQGDTFHILSNLSRLLTPVSINDMSA